MAITWDSVNDAKLITAFQQTSQVDYDAIARFMGGGCTVSAVKHRLARIREKAGIQSSRAPRSTATAGSPANPSTPRKPRAAGRGAGASTSTGAQSASNRGRKNTTTPTKPKRVGSSGPIHAKRGMATKKTEFKTVDGYPDLDYDDDEDEDAATENTSDDESFAK